MPVAVNAGVEKDRRRGSHVNVPIMIYSCRPQAFQLEHPVDVERERTTFARHVSYKEITVCCELYVREGSNSLRRQRNLAVMEADGAADLLLCQCVIDCGDRENTRQIGQMKT